MDYEQYRRHVCNHAVKPAQIPDGTSKTYWAGEKNLEPRYYEAGGGAADNGSMYEGHDWDVLRWGHPDLPPAGQTAAGSMGFVYSAARTRKDAILPSATDRCSSSATKSAVKRTAACQTVTMHSDAGLELARPSAATKECTPGTPETERTTNIIHKSCAGSAIVLAMFL